MNRIMNSSQAVPVVWLESAEPTDASIHSQTVSASGHDPRVDPGWERLVRLAKNEAEALAWETGVPGLVLPVLMEEKLAELERWKSRQSAVWNDSFELAFAA